jgi:UDP-2,4-diacetamido-2,4,6-trideoxy-beta-L-altropyranose hydrolase
MKVIFRVDSSLKMGTGHVMRCLTLAQALKDNGIHVEFICRKHEGNLIDKVRLSGFSVYELEALKEVRIDNKLAHSHWLETTQQQDADDCIDILRAEKIDWLIVDHYALDEQWQKRLKPYYEKIMVIDDLADRKHQCDILLDQTFDRQYDDYVALVPKYCELLLGSQYALLRPEFSKLIKKALEKRKNTQEIKNILISMGGSDIKNITYDILKNVSNSYNTTVTLGEKSPHKKMLKNYAKNKNITVMIDADNMAELMLNADLAIGAGGSTSWERCCLGLPTLLYITADNQKSIAENLERVGAVKIVKDLKKNLQTMSTDFSLWKVMSKNATTISDGLGVNRVVKYLQ